MARTRSLAALVALLCAPLGAHALSPSGAVWIVDDDGHVGVDFDDLQTAVDTAADGDVIVLRAGTYGSTVVAGRSLTILADVGPIPKVTGLEISGTPAGGAVVCRGIRVETAPGITAVTLADNLGLVWLEDVSAYGAPACYVTGANTDLVGIRLQLHGAPGSFPGPFGGPVYLPGAGILLEHLAGIKVRIHLQDCDLRGGSGVYGQDPILGYHGQDGGRGWSEYQVNAPVELVAAGCTFTGGKGSNAGWELNPYDPFGPPLSCDKGHDGGIGFLSQAKLTTLDCTFKGGSGGSGLSEPTPCGPGSPGADKLSSGTEVALPGQVRTYEVSSPVREGQPIQLDFQGQPGDLAYLLFSTSFSPFYLGPCQGTVLPSLFSGLIVIFVGPVDATGALSVAVPAPFLPSGVESLVAATQANLVSPDVACHVTTGSAFVLLDSSF